MMVRELLLIYVAAAVSITVLSGQILFFIWPGAKRRFVAWVSRHRTVLLAVFFLFTAATSIPILSFKGTHVVAVFLFASAVLGVGMLLPFSSEEDAAATWGWTVVQGMWLVFLFLVFISLTVR